MKKSYDLSELRQKVTVNEKEAAALLSVCAQTLAKWRKEDSAPPAFFRGGCWFYPMKGIEDWAAKQIPDAG